MLWVYLAWQWSSSAKQRQEDVEQSESQQARGAGGAAVRQVDRMGVFMCVRVSESLLGAQGPEQVDAQRIEIKRGD